MVMNSGRSNGFAYANSASPVGAYEASDFMTGRANMKGMGSGGGNNEMNYRPGLSSIGQRQQSQGIIDEGYFDSGYYPMAEFEMPDFGAFLEMMSAGSMDFGAILAQQQEAAAKAQGLAQVSALYSAKFDAADLATAEVNQQIADETAHAQLVGLDYNVDEASKQARINDIFANYWSESDESQLTSLIGQYGNAGYNWDLPIVRGQSKADAAKEKTPGDKAGEQVRAKTKGTKLTTEENPLGSASVLG